jgi:DNA-binding IclR family transcriptional regulator
VAVPDRNNNFITRNLIPDDHQGPASIRSVQRAIRIIICLSKGINTVTEIAQCCHLTKPTVYRLLKTLEEMLVVTQDPLTHRYYLGLLITQIASRPQANHHYLITCAMEELRRLWDLTGETVELNIMVGFQYIRIYEIISRYDLKVVAGPDPVGPVYVGATAKVLLSQLPDAEIGAVLKNIRLRRVTEHSVTDPKELIAQTAAIRERGYDISYSERIHGALCISIPIKHYFWPVALSVIGPETRLKPRVDATLKEMLASAGRINHSIAELLQSKAVAEIKI